MGLSENCTAILYTKAHAPVPIISESWPISSLLAGAGSVGAIISES